MSGDAENSRPAVSGVPSRQPAFCPYCGDRGRKDSKGGLNRGHLIHCPQCDGDFVIFDPEVGR